MKTFFVRDAPTVWKLLNGVVCVFKSAGETVHRVRNSFLGKLSRELCQLECRPPGTYVSIEGDTTKPMKVIVHQNYADNELVVGPRYIPSDFRCTWATILGVNTSGLLVLGLNEGTKEAYKLHNLHPLRTYRIRGRLGLVTDNLFINGKVIDKSAFRHVRKGALERLLSSIQASHQRSMYNLSGVELDSQAAYDLAVSGTIRPANTKLPVLYGLKCTEFNPPDFSIEVQGINEYEAYLLALIHDIGVKLHSTATCTGLVCIRHSYFSLDEALLKKHWTLENVLENINVCRNLVKEQEKLSQNLKVLREQQIPPSQQLQL